CPPRRNARDSEASVLASSSTISKCAFDGNCPPESAAHRHGLVPRTSFAAQCPAVFRQFDHKGTSFPRFASHVDSALVVGYYGLNNSQPKPGSVLLARVIGREDALALFGRKPRSRIGDFDHNFLILAAAAQCERSPAGHGIQRVEHEIGKGAMQQFWIGRDPLDLSVQLQPALNSRFPRHLELCLEQLRYASQHLVYVHGLQLRGRHLRELAESRDNSLQICNLGQQSLGTFAEDFVELFGGLVSRPHQILDRELEREERILKFMRQSSRQFAPRRYSLGLHQALFLREQLRRHLIEGGGELRHFIVAAYFHPCAPPPDGDLLRRSGQFFHRTSHASRGPASQQDGQNDASAPRQQRGIPYAMLQFNIRPPRMPDQQ